MNQGSNHDDGYDQFDELANAETVIPLREASKGQGALSDIEREQFRLLLVQSKRLTDLIVQLTAQVKIAREEIDALKTQTSQHNRNIAELQVTVKGITQAIRRIESPMRHIQASLAALGAKLDNGN